MSKILGIAGLALSILMQGVEAAPLTEGDLDRLQGRWEAKVGRKEGTVVTLEIKGQAVAATITTPRGLKIRADGEVRLDETTSPKTLDWVKFTTLDGEEVPALRAIYRLEEGRLQVRSGGSTTLAQRNSRRERVSGRTSSSSKDPRTDSAVRSVTEDSARDGRGQWKLVEHQVDDHPRDRHVEPKWEGDLGDPGVAVEALAQGSDEGHQDERDDRGGQNDV